MSAIFVSHSSRDAGAAAELRQWLSSKGHRSVFLDFDPEVGIPAGRNWEQELYRQIRSCRAVIVLCSRHSMASKWCFAELTQARSLGKALLPVRIDDCVIEGVITDRQVVDLTADRPDALERLWRRLLAAGVDPADVFDWDGSRPPYPGLLSFQEMDAAIFFGRDDEISAGLDLLNRVRRLGSAGIVMVLGSSGSGKSSLVRAGLVPRLRRDVERWLVVDPFQPRDDPLRELAVVVRRAFDRVGQARDAATIGAELSHAVRSSEPVHPNPLLEMARDLRISAGGADPRILLVVDQFEQLLGRGPDDPSTRLLGLMRCAAEFEGSPLLVLGTMRSDFLGAMQKSRPLLDVRFESLSVGPMSPEDTTQIIEQPARVAGLGLEPGLVQAMVADTEAEDALPLLAFTLRELYDQYGGDGVLDAQEYRSHLGGLHGAIARVADQLVEAHQLPPDRDDELRQAFMAMVRLTDDGRWVRRVAPWTDLPASIHPVIIRFVDARLLVSGGDGSTRTIEVAHEALFRSWGRLAAWLDQNAEALRLRHDLQRASRGWHDSGHDAGELWRGTRLARAVELATSGDLPLEPLDRRFVEASGQAEEAQVRREEKRRRRTLFVAVGVASVMSVLAVVALISFSSARRESDRANEEARQATALALAASSRRLVQDNPALALALAAESSVTTDTPIVQASSALLEARMAFAERSGQSIRAPLTGHGGPVSTVAFSDDGTLLASAGDGGPVRLWDPSSGHPVGEALTGHEDAVFDVVFSPDGSLLASAGLDGTVRLWDPATSEPVGEPLTGHEDAVLSVAFSPDGKLLASAGGDGTVRLWDVGSGQPVGVPLVGHDDLVAGVAFSPDGRLLASAGWDGTVRLWDPRTGEPIRGPLVGPDPEAFGVAFTPDGTRLALIGGDVADGDGADGEGTVRLWDPPTGELLANPITGHDGAVRGVAFSPDGSLLATAGDDRTVRLWDAYTGESMGDPLTAQLGGTTAVAFSPDGKVLASASDDGTVQFWDPHSGDPVSQLLTRHDQPVEVVAFEPDGTLLATANWDGTVRLWETESGDQVGEPLTGQDSVGGMAFSPHGSLLASAGADGTVSLWDPDTGERVGDPLTGHEDPVFGVAFSPDGGLLASAGTDATVRLWDSATGEPVGDPLTGHNDVVNEVAFSPDGRLLASASWDGTVRLWDPETGEEVGEPLTGHDDIVFGVAFSPDGRLLASAGFDGTVRLWDPETGEDVGEPLTGHDDAVFGLAFSPDGRLLASASGDATVRLWDPATGEPVGAPLTGHDGFVWGVAFSHDGTLLASASEDGTVRLWDNVWDLGEACDLAEPYVTAAQVETYLLGGAEPTACDWS